MNKRIKKKKAKQALLREQERLAQELAQLNPEELEDIVRTVRQGFKNIARTLASIFDGLAAFFKNMEESFENIEQQGTIQPRPRTVQVQRYRAGYLDKKSRAHVQQ